MSLFKSKAQKQMERDLQVRQAMHLLRRQAAALTRAESGFLQKAKEAKLKAATPQYSLARNALRRTIGQHRLLERQLLTLEIAAQMKDVVQGQVQFVEGLKAFSKTIDIAFGDMDLTQMQTGYERAMSKAFSIEQRIDLFLDTANDMVTSPLAESDETLVSDAELDRLIDETAVLSPEERASEADISQGLEKVRKALGQTE